MIEIDGSYGEGGGQILRTALSLSCLFKKPFRIFNIRKGRKNPGLMPQHLTAVRAAQLLSNAQVKGDYKGSTELVFLPNEVKAGEFFFDIGTAGSTSLVLQTLIPSLAFSIDALLSDSSQRGYSEFESPKSTITLKGGTHVPFSPPFDYLREIFSFFLEKIGIKLRLHIESYGFYPKGGGKVRAEIYPAKEIKPLKVKDRGNIMKIEGYSAVGNLPISIAERQKNAFLKFLDEEIKQLKIPVDIRLLSVNTQGQGTYIFIKVESEHIRAGFTALGERGKKAETVGEEIAKELQKYHTTNAALDPHIADQIVLYLSLSQQESIFTTSCITQHLVTNLWTIKLFHNYYYSVKGEIGEQGTIIIKPL